MNMAAKHCMRKGRTKGLLGHTRPGMTHRSDRDKDRLRPRCKWPLLGRAETIRGQIRRKRPFTLKKGLRLFEAVQKDGLNVE